MQNNIAPLNKVTPTHIIANIFLVTGLLTFLTGIFLGQKLSIKEDPIISITFICLFTSSFFTIITLHKYHKHHVISKIYYLIALILILLSWLIINPIFWAYAYTALMYMLHKDIKAYITQAKSQKNHQPPTFQQ